MSDPKPSMLTTWLVAIAILVGLSAVYTGAYFGLSTSTTRNLATGGRQWFFFPRRLWNRQ
jgi:hypothetical protein